MNFINQYASQVNSYRDRFGNEIKPSQQAGSFPSQEPTFTGGLDQVSLASMNGTIDYINRFAGNVRNETVEPRGGELPSRPPVIENREKTAPANPNPYHTGQVGNSPLQANQGVGGFGNQWGLYAGGIGTDVSTSNPQSLQFSYEPVKDSQEPSNQFAKRAVIQQLLGEGTGESKIFEEALSSFSLDNLLLLSQHGVKFHSKRLKDMPVQDGVRKHFMDSNRKTIDEIVRGYNAYYKKGLNPDTMSHEEKIGFLRKEISDNDRFITLGDIKIDSSNLSDLEEISRVGGRTISNGEQSTVFIPQRFMKKEFITHEAAHALDIIKRPRDASPFKVDNGTITPSYHASEHDGGLRAHYECFLRQGEFYPAGIWSRYAFDSKDVAEYTAEAVATFIENPQKLKQSDPEMYRFAEAFTSSARYPSIRFA